MKSILILINLPEIFDFLKSSIESVNPDCHIVTPANITDLKILEDRSFNLVITNLNSADLLGRELYQALHLGKICAPVVVISNDQQLKDDLRAYNFKFIDYPLEDKFLSEVLNDAIGDKICSQETKDKEQENLDFLKEIRQDFIVETCFMLDECENAFLRLEDSDRPLGDIDEIFRLAHSIKGSANAIGIKDLADFSHEVENLLMTIRRLPQSINSNIVSLLLNCNDAFKAKIQMLKEDSNDPWDVDQLKFDLHEINKVLVNSSKDQPEVQKEIQVEGLVDKEQGTELQDKKIGQEFIRVPKQRIEHVSNIVGELIILKSQLVGHKDISSSSDVRLNNIVRLLDGTLRELQDRSMELALDNLKGLFLKIQRVARDTSEKLNKPVQFKMSGEEVEIDRLIIESLYDPLLHIIRNSIDHGIESQDKRQSSGKQHKATLLLSARQAFGKVIIEITDDGGGIDPDFIFERSVSKGLVSLEDKDNMSDEQKIQLIFEPGFSTVEQVTDLSGRGVGLDVVKTNINKVKGSVQVESKVGSGTCFRLILPMTQAVTEGMVIRVDSKSVVLPLISIKEVVCLETAQCFEVSKGLIAIDLRGENVPLYSLSKLLRKKSDVIDHSVEGRGIVIETPRGLIVVSCHDVLEQSQLVVKGLGDFFEKSRGVAGGAILGDGTVALVVDIEGLLEIIDQQNRQLKQLDIQVKDAS